MTDPKSYEEAREHVLRFDSALQAYLQQHPRDGAEWQTPEPYVTMLAATERYAEAAMKDAIWAFAQTYVDIAATGTFGRKKTTHAEIPAEFQDLFGQAMDAVAKASGVTPDEEIENIYLRLWDIMWDAITFGIFPRARVVGADAVIIRGHLYANETLLRQVAETIYEIKQASRRLGPIAFALAGWKTTGGKPETRPERVEELVFYTGIPGKEKPPVWAEIHIALVGTPIVADIGRMTGQTFRETVSDATGLPQLQQMGTDLTDIMGALGGVVGALTWVGLLVGGFALYRFATKG